MITRSKKAINTVFYVPLTADANGMEGRRFLALTRQFLNTAEYRIRIRGRNEDRAGTAAAAGLRRTSFHQDVPMENATYAAVYIDGKTTRRMDNAEAKRLWQQQHLHAKTELYRQGEDTNLRDLQARAFLGYEASAVRHRTTINRLEAQLAEANTLSWRKLWRDARRLVAAWWSR